MGEITKAESYLLERLEMLSDEKVIIITKINNIDIEQEEIDSKIVEIQKDVDEAFEIFSPRAKKNDFIRDEINKLNVRCKDLGEMKEAYSAQLKLVNEDIAVIKDALGDTTIDDDEDGEIIQNYVSSSYKNDDFRMDILKQQELERQRIARDLHDTTVQVLTNLVHKCEICSKIMDVDSTRAKLELEIMSKTLRETIDDMRNIIYDLRPMAFDDLGLETTLRNAISKIDANTDMYVSFNINGDMVEVSSVIALTLLRIMQEASSNSIKYSKGKHLDVLLNYNEDDIELTIKDDGIGFEIESLPNPGENNKGFGLSIMKERVFLLSGKIKIESKINGGTAINIKVPIQ